MLGYLLAGRSNLDSVIAVALISLFPPIHKRSCSSKLNSNCETDVMIIELLNTPKPSKQDFAHTSSDIFY